MSGDLADLGFNVNTSGLRRGQTAMGNYAVSGRTMERSVVGSVAGISSSFTNLTTLITLASAAMLALGTSKAITTVTSFETAMAGLSAVSSATTSQLAALEEQARSLGATSKFSAIQAAEGQSFLAMAGFSVNEILSATPDLLNLATAGVIDLGSASDIASNVLGGMQLEVSGLSKVIDVMAKTASSSNTNIRQLGEALSYAAPFAASANVSIEEVSATIGSLSNAGVQASRAGTGVIAILRQLLNPTADATDALKSYGISIGDVDITSNGLVSVLQTLKSASLTTADAIRIFGSEGATAALIAAKSADEIESMVSSLDNAEGSAKKMADTMSGTTAVAALGLASAIAETALQLGEDSGLNASLRDTIQLATGVVSSFNGMLPEFIEANSLAAEFKNTVDSLVSSGEAFVTVIGTGLVIALGKSTAATASQIAADLTAINSARAAGIARATVGLSASKAATVMAVAEAEVAAARVFSTKQTVSALIAELELEKTRLAAQITQIGRIKTATRMAEIQTAKLAITKSLTIAEAQLLAATTASTRAEAAQAVATTTLSRAQGVATATTTALGTAIKFALGPWGLLAAAIGTAAAVFLTASDNADTLTDSLSEQEKVIDTLKSKYKGLTTAQLASNYQQAQRVMIGYDQQRLDLTNRLLSLESGSSRGRSTLITQVKNQLKELEAQAKPTEDKLKSIMELLDQGVESLVPDIDVNIDSTSGSLPKVDTQLKSIKTNALEVKGIFDDWVTGAANSSLESDSTSGLASLVNQITSTTKIGQLQELNKELELTQDLLDLGVLDESVGAEKIESLHDAISELNKEEPGEKLTSQFDQATDAISNSLTAMRELTEQGTSGYYKLSTAMAAVEAAQAAMAIAAAATTATITGGISAAVSLISAISTLGGDLDTTFEATQAVQGLDEWGEKADSISTATEDTANATEDLVGINTDMLDALVNLQSALQAASGIAQKEISSTDIATNVSLGSFFDNISNLWANNFVTEALGIFTFGASDFVLSLTGGIFDVLGSVFGGSSKTTDSGVQVLGGSIADMIDDANVLAFETIKSKKYAWSSSKSKTYTTPLDDASTQFGLVFESLADSVYESGIALGFSSEYLNDAINNFVIDTTSISLRKLSSDEITDEIESYFSNVFSDLAENVVFYIGDFQNTGEELSETLTRISTQVNILNYAADNLGFAINIAAGDSEALVTIADNLSDSLGGAEGFSNALSSFIGAFASDAELLRLYGTALDESLSAVGLSLPETTEGMWELIGSLDSSTVAGQDQIATLLSLSGTSEEYYGLLEAANDDILDAQESMADLSDTFANAVSDIYEVSDATSQMSLDAALAAARMGDFSLAESLNAGDYNLDSSGFASLADYNIAQAEAANKLLQLSQLAADNAGDVETEQLNELKAINASIIASLNETNTLLKSQNRTAIDTSDYLDQINNKTSYAA